MKFRTILKPLDHKGLINYQSKITMLGSCFVENIGERLNNHQFDLNINPFGIVFNPKAIADQISRKAVENRHFIEKGDKVVSLDFHSKYNAKSADELESKIRNDFEKLENRIVDSNILVLTFGTAWVYKYSKSNNIISNCQKVDGTLFEKQLLDLAELKDVYKALINDLLEKNPSLKIVLTVSPVRHLKDGLIENNRSKAILLSLCGFLELEFPKNVIYYPSYELVMDDLRDYRFFNKDLLHPNEMAIDYIYDHFQNSFMDDRCIKTLQAVNKYNQLKAHKNLQGTELDSKKREGDLDEMQAEIDKLKLS